jgi:hypothetical protein
MKSRMRGRLVRVGALVLLGVAALVCADVGSGIPAGACPQDQV